MNRSVCPSIALLSSLFALVGASAQPFEPGRPEIILHPPNPVRGGAPAAGSTSSVKPAIQYHGGPVMAFMPNVYVIWYGSWGGTSLDTTAGQQIIRDFLTSVGGSTYFNVNTTYSTSTTVPSGLITGNINFAGETGLGASTFGTALSDGQILNIVAAGIGSQDPDPNGVYFVLTSSDVTATSGFCTKYCGWHTHGSINGVDVKYSFVGNAARCLSSCAAQTVSPNGDAGVDGMVSVIAHELEEAVTDPDLNAWWDAKGYENADKCAWTFGTMQKATSTTGGTYYYNLTLPTDGSTDPATHRRYLIQRNLLRAPSGNYCVRGIDDRNQPIP